jgi:hypothetical protein
MEDEGRDASVSVADSFDQVYSSGNSASVFSALARLRGRVLLRAGLRWFWVSSLVLDLSVLAAACIVPHWFSSVSRLIVLAALLVCPTLLGLIRAVSMRLSIDDIARLADYRASLAEQVSTAYEVTSHQGDVRSPTAFEYLLSGRAIQMLERAEARIIVPLQREGYFAVAALVLSVLISAWNAPQVISWAVAGKQSSADSAASSILPNEEQPVRVVGPQPPPNSKSSAQPTPPGPGQPADNTPKPAPTPVSGPANQNGSSGDKSGKGSNSTGDHADGNLGNSGQSDSKHAANPGQTNSGQGKQGQQNGGGSGNHNSTNPASSGQKGSAQPNQNGQNKAGQGASGQEGNHGSSQSGLGKSGQSGNGKSGHKGTGQGHSTGAGSKKGSSASGSGGAKPKQPGSSPGGGPVKGHGQNGSGTGQPNSGQGSHSGQPGGQPNAGGSQQQGGPSNQHGSESGSSAGGKGQSGMQDASSHDNKPHSVGSRILPPMQNKSTFGFKIPNTNKPGTQNVVEYGRGTATAKSNNASGSTVSSSTYAEAGSSAPVTAVEHDPAIPAGYRALVKRYFSVSSKSKKPGQSGP